MSHKEFSDWTEIVKTSRPIKGLFSAPMKQVVLDRIQTKEQRNGVMSSWIYGLLSLAAIMLLLTVFALQDRLPSSLIPVDKVTDGIISAGPAHEAKLKLIYQPPNAGNPIPQTDTSIRVSPLMKLLPLRSIVVDHRTSVEGVGAYLDFRKYEVDGQETFWFGFQMADTQPQEEQETFYPIGYGKMTDVHVVASKAFGIMNMRMEGQCGTEVKCVYWISRTGEQVRNYELTYVAELQESDVNNDGIVDAVMTAPDGQVYIYMNVAGQIQSVHVQAAGPGLQANRVTYDPKSNVFLFASEQGAAQYRYSTQNDELIRL